MRKIGPKQHKQTTVTSYYVNAVFDLPSESEYRFTMYPNSDRFNRISPLQFAPRPLGVLRHSDVCRIYRPTQDRGLRGVQSPLWQV